MEKVESISFDENLGELIFKTEKRTCRVNVDSVGEEENKSDDFKRIMDEIGENISKIANKSGEMLNEKRKDILRGLRDWINKEVGG